MKTEVSTSAYEDTDPVYKIQSRLKQRSKNSSEIPVMPLCSADVDSSYPTPFKDLQPPNIITASQQWQEVLGRNFII